MERNPRTLPNLSVVQIGTLVRGRLEMHSSSKSGGGSAHFYMIPYFSSLSGGGGGLLDYVATNKTI